MMSAVNAVSSSGCLAILRCVDRCWPKMRHANRSETPNVSMARSTQMRRRAGLTTFQEGPLSGAASPASDPTPLAQTCILRLKLLEPLYLVALQTAIFLAPPIIGNLCHAYRSNRFLDRSA